MWMRAVWVEGDVEVESTVPETWVNLCNKFVWWPPVVNAENFLKERREPAEKWRKFPLVKIKLTSGRE